MLSVSGFKSVEIFGKRDFFERTKTVRDDIKDSGIPVDEHLQEEENTSRVYQYARRVYSPNESVRGQILITSTGENKEGLVEGIVKVVEGEPILTEKALEPVKIKRDEGTKYILGVQFSIESDSLNEDILRFMQRFNT